ncbi:MAG TPA: hypothetical protein DDW90_02695 [Cyanobacteria bacterium UBA9971]|nr:hypothetical protein [Cyanobacteria bacterium UBA9971]
MRNILKTTVILSAIIGLIAGVLLLVPFFTPFITSNVFLSAFLIIGAAVVVYIKKSKFVSLIVGVLLFIIFLAPLLTPFILLSIFLIIGAVIIFYLKKNQLIGILSLQDGTIIGAVSGFVSLIAASVVYIPIWLLINFIWGYHQYKLGFGGFIFIVIAVALLISAPCNAFAGMLAAYIYEKIEDKPFDFQSHLEIEQDD